MQVPGLFRSDLNIVRSVRVSVGALIDLKSMQATRMTSKWSSVAGLRAASRPLEFMGRIAQLVRAFA